jgi:gamma-glutamyltranspeptidase
MKTFCEVPKRFFLFRFPFQSFPLARGTTDLPECRSFWPRQAKPGRIQLEGRFPTVAALRQRGHDVGVGEDWSEGRLSACAAERTAEGVVLKAGANPRGMQGYAVGR